MHIFIPQIGLLILGGAAIITIIEEENIQEEDIVKCFVSPKSFSHSLQILTAALVGRNGPYR